MKINKIIIPAAGIGSRFLPITKSIPKEMLPLSNKPAIQYIVEEAYEAGISEQLIVISPEKLVIKDYFTRNHHLDKILEEQNKTELVFSLNRLIDATDFQYFLQNKPAGLANALLHAQHAISKDEYFAVALPDDIIFGDDPEIAHLMKYAEQEKAMVIAVQEVEQSKVSSYGVIAPAKQLAEDCWEIESLVEKPAVKDAPSNLAIVGRYVFHASLFDFIPKTPVAKNGEILLPDTINLMIQNGMKVIACKVKGKRFDTGTPQGWLQYIVDQGI